MREPCELFNHMHAWLEKWELEWTSDVVDSSGKAFINVLTDILGVLMATMAP